MNKRGGVIMTNLSRYDKKLAFSIKNRLYIIDVYTEEVYLSDINDYRTVDEIREMLDFSANGIDDIIYIPLVDNSDLETVLYLREKYTEHKDFKCKIHVYVHVKRSEIRGHRVSETHKDVFYEYYNNRIFIQKYDKRDMNSIKNDMNAIIDPLLGIIIEYNFGQCNFDRQFIVFRMYKYLIKYINDADEIEIGNYRASGIDFKLESPVDYHNWIYSISHTVYMSQMRKLEITIYKHTSRGSSIPMARLTPVGDIGFLSCYFRN